MLPQASQTWRGSESPGGTRWITPVPQLGQNFIEGLYDVIDFEAQPVDRRLRAVDPVDAKAERFGAERVPAIRGNEADLFLWRAELLYRQRVDLRRGLEDFDGIHAEYRVELQTGLRDKRVEHVRRAIAEYRVLARLVFCEEALDVGIEREPQIVGHQGCKVFRFQWQGQGRAGKLQSLPRDLRKGNVAAHQASQPGVFELLRAPELRKRLAFAGPQLVAARAHRKGIEQRPVSVEDQRSNHA